MDQNSTGIPISQLSDQQIKKIEADFLSSVEQYKQEYRQALQKILDDIEREKLAKVRAHLGINS